jgi:hypothetical protein
MDSTKGQLFSKQDLTNAGKLLHKSSASIKDESEVQVELYENGLVEYYSKNFDQRRSFVFDFDVKFSFTTNPAEVTF